MRIKCNNYYFKSNLYQLTIKQNKNFAYILMELLTNTVSTQGMSSIVTILKKELPTIFESKCFNDKNLPFLKEVERTEIGHLFEHIVLENLCEIKASRGFKDVIYSGNTSWNWEIDKKGIFHIKINVKDNENSILMLALQKSTNLLNTIINNHILSQNLTNIPQNTLNLYQYVNNIPYSQNPPSLEK